MQRQLLAQRGKISGEPLGIYVSDIATKQNKLDMQENTRVYHFIEGLKPELQMEDLKVKPKTLHWTDWTAKEFDALVDAHVLDIFNRTHLYVLDNQWSPCLQR